MRRCRECLEAVVYDEGYDGWFHAMRRHVADCLTLCPGEMKRCADGSLLLHRHTYEAEE